MVRHVWLGVPEMGEGVGGTSLGFSQEDAFKVNVIGLFASLQLSDRISTDVKTLGKGRSNVRGACLVCGRRHASSNTTVVAEMSSVDAFGRMSISALKVGGQLVQRWWAGGLA
jgi:hypothetical protein